MDAWRLGRRPALDGLRGVAILLVLVCHLAGAARGRDNVAVGAAGVTVFFVLSGFLITSLLVEAQATGRPLLGAFYLGRARRLLPGLVFVVAVLAALEVALHQTFFRAAPVLFYVANWAQIAGPDVGIMRHAWSLSIEEQFYLVWPLLLLASLRRRWGPVVLCTAGITVSLWLRLSMGGTVRVYYGTDTEAFPLLLGALLAILAHRGLPALRLPSWVLAAGALALFALTPIADPRPGYMLVPTVVALLAVALVWGACTSGGLLATAPLRYVGRRSYALYLWHYPLILLVRLVAGPSLVWGLVAVALAFGVAEVSWRFVESPFLRRRAARPAAVPDVVPAG